VICKHHIQLPDGANIATSVFICIACHLEVFPSPQPYFVSAPHNPLCYLSIRSSAQGFYNGTNAILDKDASTWKSPLSAAVKIQADYQMTAKSHVCAAPLLVFHFVLSSIRCNGNPARFISDSMGEYLPNGSFRFEEILFDFTADSQVELHARQMNMLVNELQR
jgi:hypothetical protein